MKRILLYIAFFQFAALFTSCEKEIMGYQGKEGVYFATRHGEDHRPETSWPYQPYTEVDFVRINLDETVVAVPIAITGPIKDYDRVFHIEVNPDSTTAILGQHYEAVQREWTIPAGAISVAVTVRVIRTADLEELPKTLGLRLVATDDFALSFPEWDAIPSLDGGATKAEFDASLHTLRLNDIMVQPAEWLGSLRDDNSESGLLGIFTRRKMEFLIEHLGLTYEDFANPEIMPRARMMLIASDATEILVKLLNERKPVLEDDGRLMWLGTVPWTSYVGVPYVPVP